MATSGPRRANQPVVLVRPPATNDPVPARDPADTLSGDLGERVSIDPSSTFSDEQRPVRDTAFPQLKKILVDAPGVRSARR